MTARPSDPHIGLVVEGSGDVNALPVLLRKYQESRGDYRDVLGKPICCHGRDKAITPKGLEGFVATAASRPGCVAVLVMLDGEGDAVCELGSKLLRRAKSVTGTPVSICLADRNFEDWIYASAETLKLDMQFDPAASGLGSIVRALAPAKYVKPTWQPRLVSRMDLDLAIGRSASLTRLVERYDELLARLPA